MYQFLILTVIGSLMHINTAPQNRFKANTITVLMLSIWSTNLSVTNTEAFQMFDDVVMMLLTI